MNFLQLLGAVEIGLIYSIVAIGVYITFKVMDFPDLTVDGSFTLGAAVVSAMIVGGFDPYLSTFCAILSGMVAGAITGYLNVRWNILGLLAGILVMTALYSINLRVMGRPNIALIGANTIFDDNSNVISFSIIIVLLLIVLLHKFFISNFGLGMRAAGLNAKVSKAYGINVGRMRIIALLLSNGVVALVGALFAQSQGFSDISIGTGTVIIGLASVIIGETIIRPQRIWIGLVACVIGSVLYRIVIAFALNIHDIGLEASDLNLITSLLVVVTMVLPKLKLNRR